MDTNPVVGRVCGVRRSCDLDLTPLTVGRGVVACGCAFLELLVDSLLFNAALSLDQGGVWYTVSFRMDQG